MISSEGRQYNWTEFHSYHFDTILSIWHFLPAYYWLILSWQQSFCRLPAGSIVCCNRRQSWRMTRPSFSKLGGAVGPLSLNIKQRQTFKGNIEMVIGHGGTVEKRVPCLQDSNGFILPLKSLNLFCKVCVCWKFLGDRFKTFFS